MADDLGAEELPPPARRRKSRLDMWRDGELSTDDLDLEEVNRGFPRNHDGRFGPGPTYLPAARYRELQARRLDPAVAAIQALTPLSTARLQAIIASDDVAPADQLRAVALVLERSVPKVREQVDVQLTARPWEAIVAPSAGILRVIPKADDEAEDAEVDE